jgi:hypothetical protein
MELVERRNNRGVVRAPDRWSNAEITSYKPTTHEGSSALTAQERLIGWGSEYPIRSVVVMRID